ncbi:M23 family metallopeptidase [Thermopolyspora sp. NPDC052614]|uniref:M23 family metallopeptidase n=1 Tax=Thermopolyspora sp. NPDC052614 TaxID=3155682 RepID=UPI003440DC16
MPQSRRMTRSQTPLHRARRYGRQAARIVLALTLAAASGFTSAPEPRRRPPLDGPIHVLRHFAPPAFPWLAGHRGVDLAAEPGAQVKAPAMGRIGYTGRVAGRGVVTILHEHGLRTTYLPVRPLVERGAPVRPGDVIGLLEPLPGHCPVSCLHWGLLRDRHYLDPLLLLGRPRVRLLPFWHVPFGSPAFLPPTPPSPAPRP